MADLTAELARPLQRDGDLMAETITADDLDGPFQDQPGGHVARSNVEDDFTGSEYSSGAAGEALGCLHLHRVQYGEHLVTAGVDDAHC